MRLVIDLTVSTVKVFSFRGFPSPISIMSPAARAGKPL